jgi:2-polyprenyl-6-hydroxyphenyl methylase/3-demethylubiquinone-9 3-methyltransferase
MQLRNTNQDNVIDFFSNRANEFHSHYEMEDNFRERWRIWKELLDRHAVAGKLAIDMGCGSGVFAFYMAELGLEVTGVDASGSMIALCENRSAELALDKLRFVRAELPFVEGVRFEKADLIVCSSVLEYIQDFEETLALFTELLKTRGTLLLSLPNALCPNRLYQRLKFRLVGKPEIYKYIKNFVTPRGIESLLKELGLRMIEIQFYDHPFRVSRLCRTLKLPPSITEDLFVAVFVKGGNSHDASWN